LENIQIDIVTLCVMPVITSRTLLSFDKHSAYEFDQKFGAVR